VLQRRDNRALAGCDTGRWSGPGLCGAAYTGRQTQFERHLADSQHGKFGTSKAMRHGGTGVALGAVGAVPAGLRRGGG